MDHNSSGISVLRERDFLQSSNRDRTRSIQLASSIFAATGHYPNSDRNSRGGPIHASSPEAHVLPNWDSRRTAFHLRPGRLECPRSGVTALDPPSKRNCRDGGPGVVIVPSPTRRYVYASDACGSTCGGRKSRVAKPPQPSQRSTRVFNRGRRCQGRLRRSEAGTRSATETSRKLP